MNTGIWIGITIIALLLIGGAYLAFFSGQQNSAQTTAQAGSSRKAQTYSVAIRNYSFSPASLTIRPGDTIVWTNNDTVAPLSHQILGMSFQASWLQGRLTRTLSMQREFLHIIVGYIRAW